MEGLLEEIIEPVYVSSQPSPPTNTTDHVPKWFISRKSSEGISTLLPPSLSSSILSNSDDRQFDGQAEEQQQREGSEKGNLPEAPLDFPSPVSKFNHQGIIKNNSNIVYSLNANVTSFRVDWSM